AFQGGVIVGAGNINNDGFADIITCSGQGGASNVRVFTGNHMDSGILPPPALANFFAFNPSFTGGAFVSAGDSPGARPLGGVVGAGPGGPPAVRVIDGTKLNQVQANGQISSSALLADFLAYDGSLLAGVRVDTTDANGDGKADIVTGPGPGGGPNVRVFRAT